MRDWAILPLAILFSFLWLNAPPRFYPLAIAAFLASPLLMDTLAAKRWGWMTPWQVRPVTVCLDTVYGLYALAVATGVTQWGSRQHCDLFLQWALVFGLAFLNMVLSALYSRRQFRRLQQLVNEDPPAEENHGAD